MNRVIAAAAACLVLVGGLTAAPPTLTLPDKVTGAPGAFVTVSAMTTGKSVSWLVLDQGLNLFPVNLLKDSHTAVVTSGTPGIYRLLAVTALGDEISVPAICAVTILASTPPPAPTPSPTPTPAPTPTPTPPQPTPSPSTKAVWAIVVIDNNARTVALGQLLSSQALTQGLQARSVKLRVLDITDPLIASNGYQPAIAAAGGTPALLLYGDKGERINAVPLPGDVPSFLAAIPNAAKVEPTCGPNGCPFCPRNAFVFPEKP